MSVRSNGKLLAGIGVVLGLCAAGVGCQSSTVRPSSVTPPLGQARTAPGGTPAGVPGGGLSQSVNVLKPVAASVANEGAVQVSVYKPTERVGDDEGREGAPTGAYVVRTPSVLTGGARASIDMPVPQPQPQTQQQTPPQTQPVVTAGPQCGPEHPVVPAAFHGHHHGPLEGVPGVPREQDKQTLPIYRVAPPDILLIRASPSVLEPVRAPLDGQHLVRPDGSINLGVYGDVWVAGHSLDEIRDLVALKILERTGNNQLKPEDVKKELQVDVLAYNSQVYYVITDGGGYGEQVYPIPIKGNETVLDAIGAIGGIPPVGSKKKIWVARSTPYQSPHPIILPVDWCAVAQYGRSDTNYQIFPGDRIYVQSNPLIKTDSLIAQVVSPIERLLGVTLLGSSTVNSIRTNGRTSSSGNGSGF
jgi:polysaccharide export outer membrane protein